VCERSGLTHITKTAINTKRMRGATRCVRYVSRDLWLAYWESRARVSGLSCRDMPDTERAAWSADSIGAPGLSQIAGKATGRTRTSVPASRGAWRVADDGGFEDCHRRVVAVGLEEASAWTVERVVDGGRVPAAAALGGGNVIGVESVRDRGQAVAGCSLTPDPVDRVLGDGRGPA